MKRKEKRKGKQRLQTIFILIFILLISGLIGLYRMVWLPEQPNLVRVEAGAIKHEVEIDATFANQEYVLQAPLAGKVSFIASDGQRFRKGESIATITPEGVAPGAQSSGQSRTVSAPHGGLLYHKVDGLEGLLTPDNLVTMDLNKLVTQSPSEKALSSVQTGEIFGKIVDNLTSTSAFLELPGLDGITKGQNLSLRIDGKTENAKILRKSESPKGVVVQFAHFIDSSLEKRKQKLNWIMRPPVNGIIVPKTALWQDGGKEGIYLVVEGVIRFREVKVLDANDTEACIKDLKEGMFIVSNPRQGLEGMSTAKK